MRLRTFTASDMPTAMKMVREAMGDDAIILSSEAKAGRRQVSVTAALDDRDPLLHAANAPLRDSDFDQIRFEIQNRLRFHNIPEMFISKIMARANDKELSAALAKKRGAHQDELQLYLAALEKLLGDFFAFEPLALNRPPLKLMLVGMPGIGKTLTVAKLATRLALDKHPLVVITTDHKRAGGIEQLQAFTNILGIELKTAASRSELWRHVHQAGAHARILIDTAGCNPYDQSELAELTAYASLEDIEPVLVMQAGGDSMEALDMVEAFAAMPLKRLLLTRTDTARRFGSILAVAAAGRLSFCNASNSSSVVEPLQPIDSAWLAKLLIGYQPRS